MKISKLEDDCETEIEYVYHLSDIHIRNTLRHVEYKEVFERAYDKIKLLVNKDDTKKSLIVLTGDIMHTKTELSPEAIHIAYHFFKELSAITTVVLIAGNHDCNLSNKSRMDALTPIVEDLGGSTVQDIISSDEKQIHEGKLHNFYYLKNSGFYQYYNIVFGVTSVCDDVLLTADKMNNTIYSNIGQENKYKIALFHGLVRGAHMDNDYIMKRDDVRSSDFKGYDYVMLGAIHKHQYMGKHNTIAYAGSLIQQSHGESIENHGFLKWNLLKNKTQLFSIFNNYGYCTIDIIDGKMIDTYIPQLPRIRFILENTSQTQYQRIRQQLEKDYQVCEIVVESNFRTKLRNNFTNNYMFDFDSATKKVTDIMYENQIKTYLKGKNQDNKQIESIIELHKKIFKSIPSKGDNTSCNLKRKTKNQTWRILELHFSNMLSYGPDNMIDFRNFGCNQIIGIVAPNHYGKSAILDIILFCLFDKCSRGKRPDILNKNKDDMYCSLRLQVGTKEYLIERIGHRSKMNVKIDVKFFSFHTDENNDEISDILTGIDKNDTDAKILELVGDYDNFINTCICLQKNDKNSNFIFMTNLDKKKHLHEILKLNVFEDCYNIAIENQKKLFNELKILKGQIGQNKTDVIKKEINVVSTRKKKLVHKKNQLCESLEELNDLIDSNPQPTLIQHNELSKYKLDTEEDFVNTFVSLNKKITKLSEINSIDDMTTKLATFEKRLDDVINNDLNKSNKNLLELSKKIINIPDDVIDTDIDSLVQAKLKSQCRFDKIQKILAKYSDLDATDILNKIDTLKNKIDELQKIITYVDPESNNKLEILNQELIKNEQLIQEASYFFLNYSYIDNEKKKELAQTIKLNDEFAKQIRHTITNLELCENEEMSDTAYHLLSVIINDNKQWITNNDLWKDNTIKLIQFNDSDRPDMSDLIKISKKLKSKIINVSFDVLTMGTNNLVSEEINKLENKLEKMNSLNDSKLEYDTLKTNIDALTHQINSNNIYIKHIKTNAIINDQISDVKQQIETFELTKKNLSTKICKYKKLISEENERINYGENLKKQLRSLEKYHVSFMDWNCWNDTYRARVCDKKIVDDKINNITMKINRCRVELDASTKNLKQCLKLQKGIDKKSNEENLYNLYCQVVNHNGLPYEILKKCLPLIESGVNSILHPMVNFSIEFACCDASVLETSIKSNKKSSKKSNKKFNKKSTDFSTNKKEIGSVKINIYRQSVNSYDIDLASGFEQFIIGLALRMTLGQLSSTAKSNFFVIDEGWSCLDTENLNNVGIIMNYIKMQYEHVIIISHLEELKNESDHVISIDKNNGFSHVNYKHNIVANRRNKKHINGIELIEV